MGDAADVADALGDEHEDHGQEGGQHRPGHLGSHQVGDPDPGGVAHRAEVDLSGEDRRDVPDEHAAEDGHPSDQAAEGDRPEQHRHQGEQPHPGSLDEVRLRDGSEVETDQGHDRAGHDGRHQRVDPAGSGEAHQGTDQGQQQPHGDDAEQGARHDRPWPWRR